MSKFKTYIMWWAQSLSDQAFQYSNWKQTSHEFKGRTQKEASNKMNKFLRGAEIRGRFLCVGQGISVEHALNN